MARFRDGVFLFGFTIAALHTAAPSSAQTGSDPAAAQVLFDRARALVQQGNYDRACPQFEESLRLDPGIGTLFNLADCYERQGRIASAWTRFLEVASRAKNAEQPEREKVARERAAALEPRLSRLTIDVQGASDGLEVQRDDVEIGRPLWGTAVPVDPGQHTVSARAPSKKPWKITVDVPPNGASISVAVPTLAAGGAEAAPAEAANPAGTAAATAAVQGSSSAPDTGAAAHGSRKALTYAALGVGVVGVGVGTVFALQSHSKRTDVDAMCPDDRCPIDQRSQIESLQADANSAGKIATASFIVGGVGLAAGITLLVVGRHRESSPTGVSATPFVGPGSIGVVGRF